MIERVPNEPLREAFDRSGRTAYGVAKDLGWTSGRSYDASRVRRTLGLMDDVSRPGYRQARQTVNAQLAVRVGEVLGLDPWEIGL